MLIPLDRLSMGDANLVEVDAAQAFCVIVEGDIRMLAATSRLHGWRLAC
jgi:hypothetical protein